MTFGSVGTSLVLVSFFSVQFDEKRLKKLKRDSCFPFEGSVAAEGSVDLRTTQSDDDDDDDAMRREYSVDVGGSRGGETGARRCVRF